MYFCIIFGERNRKQSVVMINRELIRQKTIQIVYSYYLNQQQEGTSKGISAVEKELIFSLDKAYELYHGMLYLLVELQHIAVEDVEFREMRSRQLSISAPIDRRLAENRLLTMIGENVKLKEWSDQNNQFWALDIKMIENLYRAFIQTEDYQRYLEAEPSFEADSNIIRRFYRNMICENDEVSAALEDKSIYWNDDRHIIDTFVIKTLKLFKEDTTPDMELLPQYQSQDDLQYAISLLRHSIQNDQYYRSLIEQYAKGWDMHRIATMDIIIIQTALAEIIAFPSIPIPVSINEYVNISKMYSTQKNWTYVNAALDAITKQLKADHKILEKS